MSWANAETRRKIFFLNFCREFVFSSGFVRSWLFHFGVCLRVFYVFLYNSFFD